MSADYTAAQANCYACGGTGFVQGFGDFNDKECPCVARCESCGDQIEWAHDDEKAPRLCAACAGEPT